MLFSTHNCNVLNIPTICYFSTTQLTHILCNIHINKCVFYLNVQSFFKCQILYEIKTFVTFPPPPNQFQRVFQKRQMAHLHRGFVVSQDRPLLFCRKIARKRFKLGKTFRGEKSWKRWKSERSSVLSTINISFTWTVTMTSKGDDGFRNARAAGKCS